MGIIKKRPLLPTDAEKRYGGSGPEVDPDRGIYLRLGADKSEQWLHEQANELVEHAAEHGVDGIVFEE